MESALQKYFLKLTSINFWRMQQKQKHEKAPLVQNVVSFANLNLKEETLDLKLIAQKAEGCRYDLKRFPAVIMRKTRPRSTILVFSSGKMIIIGAQSEQDAEKAAKVALKDFTKVLNLKMKINDFRITNIVANADFGWRIDLGKLCQQRYVVRNQNFPGVIYKNMKNVKSALIFSSGKVVFTGAKNKDDIDKAFIELKMKFQKYRKL